MYNNPAADGERAARDDNRKAELTKKERRAIKKEDLTKAEHAAGFLVDDLRRALSASSQVEGLLILKMVEQAATLYNEIKQLNAAIKAS